MFTQLSLSALPGKPHTFLAKTAAVGGHAGEFTELSVLGVPGKRHTFSAKDPASDVGVHVGEFTALSVLGVPGGRHTFFAKTAAKAAEESTGSGWNRPRYRDDSRRKLLLQDDREIIDFCIAVTLSGIFDE